MIVSLILPTVITKVTVDDELKEQDSFKPFGITNKNFGVFYNSDYTKALVLINLEQNEIDTLKLNDKVEEVGELKLKADKTFKDFFPNFDYLILRKRLFGSYLIN